MFPGFEAAFKAMVGSSAAPISQTPGEVFYAENKLRVLHYTPVVEQPNPEPLLIIPSLLYRYSILDLVPGASLVGYLVEQGVDVYLLDWGSPGREDRFITFDQYISGYLRRVVQRIRRHTSRERVNLLGYGLGGTMTAIFTALYGQYVGNLVQLVAPIAFHDDGLMSQWTRKGRFNVDLVVDTLGSMPAELMRASFRMLKPTTLIMQKLTMATQLGDGQAVQDFTALQNWITDDMPYLGEAYRKYIKDLYQENYLVQGKLLIDGKRVDLSQIECPLLTVAATGDPICPPASATVLNDLVSSTDKQVLEIPGGHISAIAGQNAAKYLWPQLAEWLLVHSSGQ
jgi:polyhydroxyalkanoate synthase subunit PhaC